MLVTQADWAKAPEQGRTVSIKTKAGFFRYEKNGLKTLPKLRCGGTTLIFIFNVLSQKLTDGSAFGKVKLANFFSNVMSLTERHLGPEVEFNGCDWIPLKSFF